MLKFCRWARYPQPVLIEGSRPLTECAEAFARMTRPDLFSRSSQGRRPFVGKVDRSGGRMWFGRLFGLNPGRTLKFALEETEHGCLLRGEVGVVMPLRIFSGSYFVFAALGILVEIAFSIAHAARLDWLYELRLLAQGLGCGLLFLYGYNGLCVLVGRRRERLGLKVIRSVMSSAEAEAVAINLLDT